MRKKAVMLLAACLLGGVLMPRAARAAAATATEAGDAAVADANALALGNATRAWQLLSAASQKEMSAAQWQAALESRTPPAKPSGQILLRAIGSFPKSSLVIKPLVQGRTAYVQL